MPRYEYTEGTSNKFWEISLEGSAVITHYGRIGAEGQRTLKELGDEAAARKEYERLIASKVKKGYRAAKAASKRPAGAKKAAAAKTPSKKPAAAKAPSKKPDPAVVETPAETRTATPPAVRRPSSSEQRAFEPLGGEVPWLVGARINGIAWSPDGEVLAAVGASRGMLFNILGETLAELAPPFGYAYDVTFSPDSELLAVGFHGGHLVLYDARSGERVRELKGHGGVPNGVRKLRFSPDGKLLASASSDRTLRIWDVKKRKQLQEHAEPADVNGLDWFPDGQRLAFCTDTSVGIYDLKKQKRVAQAAKSGSADVLVIDGGERVLADGCATKLGVLIFDAKLKLQQQLKQRDACRLRLGADGVLTVASWQGKDCGVSRWELRKRRRTQLVGHEDSAVWALDVSPRTGELAAAGDHGLVHRWDAAGDPLTTAGAAGHTKEIERLALAPAGDRLYSASSDGAVIAWELPAGKALATYHIKGSSGTEGVALSADGRTLYAAGFSGIAAFDLGSGEPLWQRKTDRVRRVLPLDEQTLVVTLGSRLVWVDARSGEALHSGRPTGGWSVHFVERLRDGRLVTGQFLGDHELALWDPAEREVAGLFEVTIAGTHGLYDMIQLADGRLLLSCADKTLRLVDERVTREETILSSKHTFDRIAISPGGAQLAATADAELTLMRFPDLEVVQHIQLPFAVSALRFLDEGQLVAGGKNGQLYRVRLQARPGGTNPMPHV